MITHETLNLFKYVFFNCCCPAKTILIRDGVGEGGAIFVFSTAKDLSVILDFSPCILHKEASWASA